jgi:hypothetical protein
MLPASNQFASPPFVVCVTVGPCTIQETLVWSEVGLPVRYRLFGVARTQDVPLNLIIGLSDDPETFLEVELDELEPLD